MNTIYLVATYWHPLKSDCYWFTEIEEAKQKACSLNLPDDAPYKIFRVLVDEMVWLPK